MLAFMRKYQKYLYFLITFVIVISFSFFGTYSTLSGNSIHEQVAFTTVSGTGVLRSNLEEMALFIGTDSEDKQLFGGIWGPNFLNDGVISKDFLETGLASLLINAYSKDLMDDFKNRAFKESHYQLYFHPQAPFIGTKNAWAHFAPNVLAQYEKLLREKDPLSPSAVNTRISLYLDERKIPAAYLKQILRYQERQNHWISPDPALDYLDLALFGYHTVDDWFGSRFTHLISEFIFNAADIAEQRGYSVSKSEALAALMQNAQESFRIMRKNPNLGVNSPSEYLDQQLYRMRLDKTKAVKLWQKVLLFRRLFNDVGQSVFVDALPYQTFNQYADEVVVGDLYRLPEALQFSDFNTLQKFEVYLSAVRKNGKEAKGTLDLPLEFLSAQEVSKKAPGLVYREYELEIAKAKKSSLHAKATIKETLNWELEEKNWTVLKTQFPELGLVKAATRDERFLGLDKLDIQTRARLDQFAREQLMASHPEWLKAILENAPIQTEIVQLPLKGPSDIFAGLEHSGDLIKLLDKAEIGKENAFLSEISFDGNHYYNIKVIKRNPELNILTFEQANKNSTLEALLNQALEIHYVQMRSQKPEEFQNADKSWKTLEDVQEQVALSFFNKTLNAIKTHLEARKDQEYFKNLSNARLAPYRFLAYGDHTISSLKKDPPQTAAAVDDSAALNFLDQFKWRKSKLHLARKSNRTLPNSSALFHQKAQTFSALSFAPNGAAYFAFVADTIQEPGQSRPEVEQVAKARFLLGSDAKKAYLYSLLPLLKEKQAISFDYLHYSDISLESDV